ncbi:MAG: HAD hydrolase-like protein [Actinomycetota bacterium]
MSPLGHSTWTQSTGRRPPNLLLFDLDGTLSDPLEGISRCLNFALTNHGYPPRTPSDLTQYIGPPLDRAFSALVGTTDTREIGSLVAKYRERYAEVGFSENVLYPGIPQMLAHLSEAGVPMAVCTSKRADFADKILQMFSLLDHFRFVDGGDTGIEKWQQIAALRDKGMVGSASLMIGDRAVDVAAARRNGMEAGGVLWGYGSRTELESEAPRYLFHSPAEIVSMIGAEIASADEAGRPS